MLMAFDATSLYPSAMAKFDSYPDLNTAEHIDVTNFDFDCGRHYIIECDVYLPQELTFIPVPYKREGMCYYETGFLRGQTYNDIDIQ